MVTYLSRQVPTHMCIITFPKNPMVLTMCGQVAEISRSLPYETFFSLSHKVG